MNLLRIVGAALLVCCGWCVGDAVQSRLNAHVAALRKVTALLQSLRREIAYRQIDLQAFYRQLCQKEALPASGTLQTLPAPPELTQEERRCFSECMAGLGRAAAVQECERLDEYIRRFEGFLQAAQQHACAQAALTHKLGLAAGALLALLLL